VVNGARYSSEGKQVITLTADGVLRWWDMETHIIASTLILENYPPDIENALFTSNLSMVIVEGDAYLSDTNDSTEGLGSNLRVWDTHSGKSLFSVPNDRTIYSAALSPDDRILAVQNDTCAAHLWNMKTGQEIMSYSPPGQADTNIHCFHQTLAFSPDGTMLLVQFDRKAVIVETVSGRELKRLELDTDSALFSLDGKYLYTTGRDGALRIWAIKS
jgi:WD40 repeat protein